MHACPKPRRPVASSFAARSCGPPHSPQHPGRHHPAPALAPAAPQVVGCPWLWRSWAAAGAPRRPSACRWLGATSARSWGSPCSCRCTSCTSCTARSSSSALGPRPLSSSRTPRMPSRWAGAQRGARPPRARRETHMRTHRASSYVRAGSQARRCVCSAAGAGCCLCRVGGRARPGSGRRHTPTAGCGVRLRRRPQAVRGSHPPCRS